MKVEVGQKFWARWDRTGIYAGKQMIMQVPVKVAAISDGVITVVEDREDNAIDFRMDGTWTDRHGDIVRLVPRSESSASPQDENI